MRLTALILRLTGWRQRKPCRSLEDLRRFHSREMAEFERVAEHLTAGTEWPTTST